MLKPGGKLCMTPQLVFLKNTVGWNLVVNKWSPYSHFVKRGIFLLFSSFINMFLLLLFFSCGCFFSFRFVFFFFFFIPLDIKRRRDSSREPPLTLDYQSWKAPPLGRWAQPIILSGGREVRGRVPRVTHIMCFLTLASKPLVPHHAEVTK